MNRPIRGALIEDQLEPVVVRMCLWAEARGEGARGMLAVWWVLHSRAVRAAGSMKEQVLKPLQFSSFNRDDPNRIKLMTAYVTDPSGWAMADAVAALAESGDTMDPTNGATHYYAPAACSPAWGRGHSGWKEHVVIGNHIFGEAV